MTSLKERLNKIQGREAQSLIKQAPLKENSPKKEKGDKVKVSFAIPLELKNKIEMLGLSITKTVIKATEEYIELNYREVLEKMQEKK